MYHSIVHAALVSCVLLLLVDSARSECGAVSINQTLRTSWQAGAAGAEMNHLLYDITITNDGPTEITSAHIYIRLLFTESAISRAWGMDYMDGRDILVYSTLEGFTVPAHSVSSALGYVIAGGYTQLVINPTCASASSTTAAASSVTTATSGVASTSSATTISSATTTSTGAAAAPSNNCQSGAIVSVISNSSSMRPTPIR